MIYTIFILVLYIYMVDIVPALALTVLQMSYTYITICPPLTQFYPSYFPYSSFSVFTVQVSLLYNDCNRFQNVFKGTVQQDLTGVKTRFKPSVLINYTYKCCFLLLPPPPPFLLLVPTGFMCSSAWLLADEALGVIGS